MDLVQGFTREALLNPDLVRLPEHEVEKTWTPPRIRVAEPDLEPVLRLLYRLGIVVMLEGEPWCLPDGTDVTGGLFGVEKLHSAQIECTDGELRHPLRVIMNFIPPNCYQIPLRGDIGALPSGYQWGALALLAQEVFLMSTRDRKCFFYIFKLPRPWRRAMTFSQKFPKRWFVKDGVGDVWISSGVVPMGWVSAVSVCQECHRTMLRAAARPPPSLCCAGAEEEESGEGLQWRFELRRDRAYPITGDVGQTHS